MSNDLEKRSTKTIKKGAIVAYASVIFSIVSRLIYTPLLISHLGQVDYGLYSLGLSLITFLMLDYGLSDTVSRYLSKYRAEGNQEQSGNFLGIIVKLYVFIDILLIGILFIVFFNLESIYTQLTFEEIQRFKTPFILVASYGVISFAFIPLNGILLSYEESFLLKICGLFQKVFLVVFIVVFLFFEQDLYIMILAPIISGLILIISKVIVFIRKIDVKINVLFFDLKLFKEILLFTFWTSIIAVSVRMVPILSPSLIGAWVGSVSITIYSIASGIENYVYTFANAINGMFLPKISRRVIMQNGNQLVTDLMIKVGRIVLLIVTPIYIGLLLLGRDFISLWVGNEYALSYYLLMLILIPGYVYLPQQIGNAVVLAKNKIKHSAIVQLIVFVIFIILSNILMTRFGVIGIGFSILISNTIRNILMNVLFYKYCGINVRRFFASVHFKFIIQSLIVTVLSYSSFFLFSGISWMSIVIKGAIIVTLYFLVMWFFGINETEKGFVLKTMKRIVRKIIS
ncbi:Polysaccharide biosynthesis protein [Candidatus Izimaplasma bacterium HR1]|jgi:O-antigen/teichoic acid export membrane protein|uniref:oligosaccharide flippase family protein n=1 Tax=Candidatus Izimoplasma sp. HR1 TaxID=1541959 RepID=UPI0004F8E244|nr:Polysaccharide biosynthesis protein [Candidatus Izimaplasma bacterium HR1]